MKKYFGAVLGGILLLSGCNLTGNTPTTAVQPSVASGPDFTTGTRVDETEDYVMDITYPVFENLNVVNDRIKKHIDAYVDDFEKNNDLAVEGEKNILNITFDTILVNEKIISVIFTVSTYYVGSAHALAFKKPFNYSLKHNSELTFNDIFSDKEKGVAFLSTYSRNYLRSKLTGDEEISEDGTAPDEHNFFDFSVRENGDITWYFIPYQVASFANGILDMTVPYQDLKDMLAPAFVAHLSNT